MISLHRCWPGTFFHRVVLIIVIGLVLLQIGNIGFFSHDRMLSETSVAAAGILDRINTVVQLLNEFPEGQHNKILNIVQSPLLSVTLTDVKPLLTDKEWRHADTLRASLLTSNINSSRFQAIWFIDDINAVNTRFAHLNNSPIIFKSHNMVVPIKFSNERWLVFRAALNITQARFRFHAAIVLLTMTVVVVVVFAMLMKNMTRPIRLLAQAADRLGTDINSPPLDVKGSRELRKSTIAFNTMQHRLQRFIEDRTQMVAAIMHDLRTYLTRLKLRTEFIEDEIQRKKAIQDIDEMQSMLSSTLTFAKNEFLAEAAQETDLDSLIKSMCDDYFDAGHDVKYQLHSSVKANVRPIAIKRALNNVIDNALKYAQTAEVTLSANDKNIQIYVKDNGPGIAANEMENVLRPFYRIESSRNRDTGGIGLGLTVTQSIVQAHGGKIEFENCQPGLLVKILLPLH